MCVFDVAIAHALLLNVGGCTFIQFACEKMDKRIKARTITCLYIKQYASYSKFIQSRQIMASFPCVYIPD